MKFDILNSIIYLFMTLFGVHSAKTEVEIPASKKEVLKIFAGVSEVAVYSQVHKTSELQ